MASSKKAQPENGSPHGSIVPAQTPGVIGLLDRADPNVVACFGDTPGPLGINDYAQPLMLQSALLSARLQPAASAIEFANWDTRSSSKEPVLTESSTAEDLVGDCRIRAMLDTIAYAEGADYSTVVKGRVLSAPFNPELVGKVNVAIGGFSRHPQIRVQVNAKIISTAAGRYQFLYDTWSELRLPDFNPASQDIGAVKLFRRRGMIKPLLAGDVQRAILNGNQEWASLPNAPYGQPTNSMEQLLKVYNDALGECQNAESQSRGSEFYRINEPRSTFRLA